MSAKAPTLNVDRGQPFKRVFRLLDNSTDPPTPLDLTGFVVRFQVRTAATATGQLLLDLDASEEALSVDLETAEVTLALDRDATRALPAGRYPWELEVAASDDEEVILFGGTLKIIDGVIQ